MKIISEGILGRINGKTHAGIYGKTFESIAEKYLGKYALWNFRRNPMRFFWRNPQKPYW